MPGPSNKGERFPAEPLTTLEIQALIGACSTRAPTGVRNAALIALLWRSGLRISEALALYPRHVDLDKRTAQVVKGKTLAATRVAAIRGEDAIALLGRWMDRREPNGHHPVFCTLKGEPMDSSYVRHLLPRLAKRAGLERRVHPHALRHTHAQELLRAGKDLADVRDQLGHENIASTDAYLKRIDPEARIRRILDA